MEKWTAPAVLAFAQWKKEAGLRFAKITYQRLGIVKQRALERDGYGHTGA